MPSIKKEGIHMKRDYTLLYFYMEYMLYVNNEIVSL